jgi:hypothetical protein
MKFIATLVVWSLALDAPLDEVKWAELPMLRKENCIKSNDSKLREQSIFKSVDACSAFFSKDITYPVCTNPPALLNNFYDQ